MELKSFYNEIQKIIMRETRYMKVYTGKVVDVADPEKAGRVKCYILELDWTNGDSAPFIYPIDKHSIIMPKINDYVYVFFLSGNRNKPRYFGTAHEYIDMTPSEYDGTETTNVLLQLGDFFIKLDESIKEFTLYDANQNKIIFNKDGIKETDVNNNIRETTNTGIKLTDKNSNTIETTGTVVNINGSTKSLVTYTELNNAITAFLILISAHVHTSAAPGSPTSTPTSAITFNITASESTKIKTG
jgi:hypothetical protein